MSFGFRSQTDVMKQAGLQKIALKPQNSLITTPPIINEGVRHAPDPRVCTAQSKENVLEADPPLLIKSRGRTPLVDEF